MLTIGVALSLALFITSPAVAASAPATMPASRPASWPAVPTDAQIRQMVRQLNHPVPARRRAAIRQLAKWGPVAFPELRRVARLGDMESALSARDLLAELESAILIGAHVRLEVDHSRVAWDEPLTLVVRAFNPTAEPIEVPWPAAGHAPATQPEEGRQDARSPERGRDADSREAGQVAAMMDAGDFLVVTGPDGQPIDLRVEPIERDRQVYDAVNLRARGTPPSHAMPAGVADRLVIPSFNRGWARYPMLTAGQYTITFAYQPEWKDPTWTKEGFGLVRSEPVTIEITQAAPSHIRLAREPLRLIVDREGDSLVARMESTWDRELWINLNLGDDLYTHARLEWRIVPREADDHDEPPRWQPESTGDVVRSELIHAMRPGGRLVVGRAPVSALRERVGEPSNHPLRMQVSVRYGNLGNALQIHQEMKERGHSVNVPTHLYSGTITSEPIILEAE